MHFMGKKKKKKEPSRAKLSWIELVSVIQSQAKEPTEKKF